MCRVEKTGLLRAASQQKNDEKDRKGNSDEPEEEQRNASADRGWAGDGHKAGYSGVILAMAGPETFASFASVATSSLRVMESAFSASVWPSALARPQALV